MRVVENLNINIDDETRLQFYHFLIKKQYKRYITTKGEERDLHVHVIHEKDFETEIENNQLLRWINNSLKILKSRYENFKFNYFCSLIFLPFMSMDPHVDISDQRKYIFAWPILPLNDENFAPNFIYEKSTDELTKDEIKNINLKSEKYKKLNYHKNGIMFNVKYYHYIQNNEHFRMSIQLVFSD